MNGIAERASASAHLAVGEPTRSSLLIAVDARCVLPREDGLGTYARNLVIHLQRLQTPHRFLLLVDSKSAGEIAPLVSSDRVELALLEAPSMKLSQHWRVPRLLRARRPDVYHYLVHDMPVAHSVPSVLTFQDLNFIRFRDYYSRWGFLKRAYSVAVCARSVRAAHHILVPSFATKGYLIERWPAVSSRVSVVPYGVHPRFREPIDLARSQRALSRHGLARSGYFLFVGTDRPHKNLARLRQAYLSLPAGVRERFPLVLVGAHNYGGMLARDSIGASDIVRLGYVPSEDLPSLYGSSYGVVIPSLEEGFGLPALEAMACGAPVLVSKGTALAEVAADAGLTFDPYSVDSIRSVLYAHASRPELHQALSRKVRSRARSFDFMETARKTLTIYEQVAASTTRDAQASR